MYLKISGFGWWDVARSEGRSRPAENNGNTFVYRVLCNRCILSKKILHIVTLSCIQIFFNNCIQIPQAISQAWKGFSIQITEVPYRFSRFAIWSLIWCVFNVDNSSSINSSNQTFTSLLKFISDFFLLEIQVFRCPLPIYRKTTSS